MGWAAIYRLLAQGRSLSGREPNSCFLNLAAQPSGTGFADVSAATGFNYSDDSRSLGITDWDFDGDVDVWMLNRSAPGVRFLKNNQSTTGSFVALKLEGTTANRNAIGARITLVTSAEDGASRSQIRTVGAGGGFLSQSSLWQHFGIGEHRSVDTLTIAWPGGSTQTLTDIQTGKFYNLRQGAAALEWTPPTKDRAPISAGPLTAPPLTNAARIAKSNRSLFPPVVSQTITGADVPADFANHGQPRFVSLWSSTCPTCRVELKNWSQQKAAFDSAGLDVLLLNVDPRAGDDISSQAKPVLEKLTELGIAFPTQLLPPAEVGSMDAFQQALSAIHLQLITPTSFLLDAQGRVAAMYRGAVETEQIIADMRLLTLPESEQPDSAAPYPGRWWKTPLGADPSKVALRMHDEGLTPQAIRYLQAEIATAEAGTAPDRFRPVFELYFSLARLNFKLGKTPEAIAAFEKTLEISPDHLLSNKDLARILYDTGETARAMPYIEKALALEPAEAANWNLATFAALRLGQNDSVLERTAIGIKLDPTNPALHFARGLAFQSKSQWNDAIKNYEQAVRLDKQQLVARNNIAWILATADQPDIRNPELATHLVTPLLKAPGSDRALFLRTAAAAKAANADFDAATKLIAQALQIAPPELIAKLKQDLALYEQGQPLISN